MSDDEREDDEREDVDDDVAVIMPVIPAELEIDPLLLALLHCAAFLDLSTDEAVDPQDAVEVLEVVGLYVQRLPADRIEALREDLEELEEHARDKGFREPVVEFVREFLYNCGVDAGGEDEKEDDGEDEDEDEDEDEGR
jgi:hypothetical protein